MRKNLAAMNRSWLYLLVARSFQSEMLSSSISQTDTWPLSSPHTNLVPVASQARLVMADSEAVTRLGSQGRLRSAQ